MTTASSQAVNAVAFLMREIRPEWDAPGCVAALRKIADLPLTELAVAAVRYAGDPKNLTPAHIADLGNRAWDSDWHMPCKTHPDCRARRTSGECAACFADRVAVTEPTPLQRKGTPPNDEDRQILRAAIYGGTE